MKADQRRMKWEVELERTHETSEKNRDKGLPEQECEMAALVATDWEIQGSFACVIDTREK